MTGGLGINMDKRRIGKLLRDPEGVEELLKETHPGTGDSPAEIFADLINVMRLDMRRMGLALGVDVECPEITPDRAAELLAGTIQGDGVELVVLFNNEEDRREQILDEILADDALDQFQNQKTASLYTAEGNA